jgi:hypothetical protein
MIVHCSAQRFRFHPPHTFLYTGIYLAEDVEAAVVPPGLLDQLEPDPAQRGRLAGAEDGGRLVGDAVRVTPPASLGAEVSHLSPLG